MSSTTRPEQPRPRAGGRSWSLAARLTAWYTGASFVLVLGATLFLYETLVSSLEREDDEFLRDKVRVFQVLLRDRPGDAVALEREVEWESGAGPSGQVYVRVLGPEGTPLAETPNMGAVLEAGRFPAPPNGGEAGTEMSGPGGQTFRAMVAPASFGPDGPAGVIHVAMDRTQEEALLAAYRWHSGLALGIALVLCAGAGYLIARRGLRPLADITATARRIRSTTLNERLDDADLPAELRTLAETFNEMLDRLEESFERLARFSADIAHELRTPVNNLRGEAEVALARLRSPEEYRDVLGSCLEEYGRLTRLIDSLLFLARAESGQAAPAGEVLDVGAELKAVREFYEAAAAEGGVTLVVRASPRVAAAFDRPLFQRAVGNLVANALAHTPAGGTVTLTAATEDDTARIEVSDTGTGIAPEHLPHVFDRFYRADPSRTSTAGNVGLGLALVKSIAALHGGTVAIHSTPGKGTCVRLVVPVSARARGKPHEA
jgi:two-component system, OmpR family, heavy metal sensor histidine kinase CusS